MPNYKIPIIIIIIIIIIKFIFPFENCQAANGNSPPYPFQLAAIPLRETSYSIFLLVRDRSGFVEGFLTAGTNLVKLEEVV